MVLWRRKTAAEEVRVVEEDPAEVAEEAFFSLSWCVLKEKSIIVLEATTKKKMKRKMN
jgi:hypothetical protein